MWQLGAPRRRCGPVNLHVKETAVKHGNILFKIEAIETRLVSLTLMNGAPPPTFICHIRLFFTKYQMILKQTRPADRDRSDSK